MGADFLDIAHFFIRIIGYTLAVSVLTCQTSTSSAAGQAVKISVNFAAYEYPPLYHTSLKGEFSGTLGETIKRMCKDGGLKCYVSVYPIARAYQLTISGTADMTISGKHPRFNDCCVATKWGYPWSAGLFSPLAAGNVPKSESEMIGRSLIVVRGWRSPYRFMPNFDQLVAEKKITVYYPDSNYGAIQMLLNGRADLLWGSIDYFWYFKKMNITGKFKYTEHVKIPIVLWVNKKKPQVIEGLNKGFYELKMKNKLDINNLLIPSLMKNVYKDAPLRKTQ
jgi:ABC-type amino acid transport substrate-binding protein